VLLLDAALAADPSLVGFGLVGFGLAGFGLAGFGLVGFGFVGSMVACPG